MREELDEIARRAAHGAVQRVLAAQNRSEKEPLRESFGGKTPLGRDDVAAPVAPKARPRRSERTLVDAEALTGVPSGSTLSVPHAALVTPLAREEAERRGIRLSKGPAESERGLCVAVGCDHSGFALKASVLASLRELGARPIDFGARDTSPVDYPDYAEAVAEAVASGQCALGVVIDGTGIGSAIAANKVPGVRAAACTDERMAESAREHNHANVLALGARWLTPAAADAILRAFLSTASGSDRHARRVAQIAAIEQRYSRHGRRV